MAISKMSMFATFAVGVVALALPVKAESRLGGLDLNGYCSYRGQEKFGTHYVNYKSNPRDEADAYSWECAIFTDHSKSSGFADMTITYNTDAVCKYQYGDRAYSRVEDPKNAYSWNCYR
jgi:hypothetical protein